MTIDEEYEQINAELFEMQRQMEGCFARLRFLAVRGADEERRRQAEASRRQLVTYTEQEAARAFHVSDDTLQRLRAAKNLPHVQMGKLVRYTDEQLAEIADLLTQPKKGRKQ